MPCICPSNYKLVSSSHFQCNKGIKNVIVNVDQEQGLGTRCGDSNAEYTAGCLSFQLLQLGIRCNGDWGVGFGDMPTQENLQIWPNGIEFGSNLSENNIALFIPLFHYSLST